MSGENPERLSALAQGLEDVASEGGFAAFGIVTPDLLRAAPREADPAAILPGYRAVVIVGAGRDAYVSLGPKSPVMLESGPSEALVALKQTLVEAGYRVVPPGAAAVSLPRLALAAGIGAASPNGMVVVERHGLSLQFFALVTDAPLPATPLPGRRPSRTVCRACRRCLQDCPAVGPHGFERAWCTGCSRCFDACPLDASSSAATPPRVR